MPSWGLILEPAIGVSPRPQHEAYVLAHVHGTREEAMAELERRAREHVPAQPRKPQRRRLFRVADGFMLVLDGNWQSMATRFTLGELLEDSAAPPPPS
ncbi:hypothetical protein [Streptomyces sp. NPDC048442]|uniref:hypothetical protein n=1 Tax=Streptomyces sp. NPDC048442 TaxID=3154823 RepID=UPI0034309ACB